MAGENSAELIRLISSFVRSEETKDVAKNSLTFLKQLDGRNGGAATYHDMLCSAMLKVINGGGQEYTDLLRHGGPLKALVVIHSNISRVA